MNVMIDLETLGTRAGCVILSIGAAVFTEKEVTDSYHRIISVRSCLDAGLTIDPDTVKWWSEQSEEAQETLRTARQTGTAPLGVALVEFRNWFHVDDNAWGNGADFDLPILSAAYVAAGFEGPPWKPYNGRCYRTLKNLRPGIHSPVVRVAAHNALADAVFQAEHAIALLAALKV